MNLRRRIEREVGIYGCFDDFAKRRDGSNGADVVD